MIHPEGIKHVYAYDYMCIYRTAPVVSRGIPQNVSQQSLIYMYIYIYYIYIHAFICVCIQYIYIYISTIAHHGHSNQVVKFMVKAATF